MLRVALFLHGLPMGFFTGLLTIFISPTLAAPTPNSPNLTSNSNPDLNLNLTLADTANADNAATCSGLGQICSHAEDCCNGKCCCMTSLDNKGDPFANYEGYCCACPAT